MEVVIVVSEHGGRSRLFTGMKTEDWGFDVVTEVKKVSGKETWRGGRQARSVATAAAKSLSRVRLFATPCTAAYQAPSSMGFSRQEY